MQKYGLVTLTFIFCLVVCIVLFLIIYLSIMGFSVFSELLQGILYAFIGVFQTILGYMQLKQVRSNGKYVTWHQQPQIMIGGAFLFLGFMLEMILLISSIKPHVLSNPVFTVSIVLLAITLIATIILIILGAKNIVSWRRKMLAGPKV